MGGRSETGSCTSQHTQQLLGRHTDDVWACAGRQEHRICLPPSIAVLRLWHTPTRTPTPRPPVPLCERRRCAAGREVIDGQRSVCAAVRRLAVAAKSKMDIESSIGKVRMIEEGGLVGAAFDVPTAVAASLLDSCGPMAELQGMVLDQPRCVPAHACALVACGGHVCARGGGGTGAAAELPFAWWWALWWW